MKSRLLDPFLTLPQDDYTVRVYATSGRYGAHGFKIWIVPDPQFFTYTIGETVSDGVPVAGAGRLESPGAEDFYDFSVPAGGLDVFFEWTTCIHRDYQKIQILDSTGAVFTTITHCSDPFLTLPQDDCTVRVYATSGRYGAHGFKIVEQ